LISGPGKKIKIVPSSNFLGLGSLGSDFKSQSSSLSLIFFQKGKFGDDKFCKQCHENGEWSKYSLSELCQPQADDIIFKPRNPENMKVCHKILIILLPF